jgi:3-oxoacyl-[acyl-carrier protein] reductase
MSLPVPNASALFDLTGEVALVTGASSGLGQRFARVLAANGASVVLAARRVDRLQDTANAINAAGGRAIAVGCDVTDTASVEAAFEAAAAAFGTVTLTVANAGLADEGRAIETSDERFRGVMDVNLDGVFRVARAAGARLIAEGRSGTVVVTASILGIGVTRGVVAYATSKAAVIQLTKALALEWAAKGIRVNAIAPGYFSTEINAAFLASEQGQKLVQAVPQRRIGAEGDLDGALLLLASPRASGYMTGSIVVVDGGHLLPIA